jgi:hypothetical protein
MFWPRLFRSHPNFFVVYLATALLHLGFAVMNWLTPERFLAPTLDRVYWLMPRPLWAAASFAVWALLTAGAYWRFALGRLGLMIGMSLMLLRGVLIELSDNPPGVGLLVWAFLAVVHYAQLAEPQSNPITSRAT